MAVSLEDMGLKQDNPQARILSKTLDEATTELLQNNKSPSRRTGELDNRGSHFYLAMYWAQIVAKQTEDSALAAKFSTLAKTLTDNEETILAELSAVQGRATQPGGYFHPVPSQVKEIMRPSATLNAALKAAIV